MWALYSYSVFRKWSPSQQPFATLEVFKKAEKNATVKGLGIGSFGELENVLCAEVVKKR
jgi:hypothetical protein